MYENQRKFAVVLCNTLKFIFHIKNGNTVVFFINYYTMANLFFLNIHFNIVRTSQKPFLFIKPICITQNIGQFSSTK